MADDDFPGLDPDSEEHKKHEHFIIMLIMGLGCILFTLWLYIFGLRWLVNTHTEVGLIAAALLAIAGWVPAYLCFFKVLRPLFKDIYE